MKRLCLFVRSFSPTEKLTRFADGEKIRWLRNKVERANKWT